MSVFRWRRLLFTYCFLCLFFFFLIFCFITKENAFYANNWNSKKGESKESSTKKRKIENRQMLRVSHWPLEILKCKKLNALSGFPTRLDSRQVFFIFLLKFCFFFFTFLSLAKFVKNKFGFTFEKVLVTKIYLLTFRK